MELDAVLDRVEEAVRHTDALSKLKGMEGRLNEAVTFHAPLWATVRQFGHAKNFGSLIVPKVPDAAAVLEQVRAANLGGDLMLSGAREGVVAVLRMAEVLAQRYHMVVANPPYAGAKGLNAEVQAFLQEKYPDTKYDFFSAFMQRGGVMIINGGLNAMITMESWMFLSSFERLRTNILSNFNTKSLVHMPYSGKGGTSMGINFGTSAFVLEKRGGQNFKGTYCCIRYYETDDKGIPFEFPTKNERFSIVSPNELKKLPGSPVSYWASDAIRAAFEEGEPLKSIGDTRQGMATSDNGRFLRAWSEVSISQSCMNARNQNQANDSKKKWFPYNKGGAYRKWYGNSEYLINWANGGADVLGYAASLYGSPTRTIKSMSEYFKPCISWSKVTTGGFSMRYFGIGFLFDVAGCSIFAENDDVLKTLLGFTNSPVAVSMLESTSPTLNFEAGQLAQLPIFEDHFQKSFHLQARELISGTKSDWDAYETSWDFTTLPLLSPDHRSGMLEATYARLRAYWQGMTNEMKRLEEENNRIFIDAYGLQDELTPKVPIEEITLTCNPAYSIKGDMSDATREARLRERTVKEFISYAIGCMFGRYSLDAQGLILANQGDTLQDYLARVPEPTFMPDADNIIPVLGDDRFEDDAYVRFRTFLSQTFAPDRLDENLAFVREALGESVRDYLAKRFFDDHVTRYKKRPIYWLVSSPKGAFQALIYMHRYNPDTLNTVLTRYVRPLRDRLSSLVRAAEGEMITASASAAQRNKAQKEIDRLNKQVTELTDWERDHLYPMALQRIQIDLDDGVKRNYPLFDGVMRAVKGMSSDE
jgi:hypothetical protein